MTPNVTNFYAGIEFEKARVGRKEFVGEDACNGLVATLKARTLKYETGVSQLECEGFLFLAERDRNKIINSFGKDSLYTMLSLIEYLMDLYQLSFDIRLLNTILKVLEKLLRCVWVRFRRKARIKYIHGLVEQIADTAIEKNSRSFETVNCDYAPKLEYLDAPISKGAASSVVVFCPTRYSSLTISVMELLKSSQFNTDLVVIRRIAKIRRISFELRRDRGRFVKKVIRKLFMSDGARGSDGGRNLSDTVHELGISDKSVVKWCDRHGVKYLFCDGLSDDAVVDALSQIQPSYGLFTGGGILSDEVLSCFGKGILNPHFGTLPQYRGMDVIEWPFLYYDNKSVGITVHLMSTGIDEGGILLSYRGRYSTDIKSLRYEFESYAPYLLVEALSSHITIGKVIEQQFEDGKRYYVLSPSLYRKAFMISRNSSYLELSE